VLPSLPLAVVVQGRGIAEANASGGGPLTSLSLPAGAFSLVTDFPGTPFIGGVHVDAGNGAGAFALTPAGGGGAMPLSGLVRLCVLSTCGAPVAVLDLPLAVVGAGGTTSVAGPPSVALIGAPWTKGRLTIVNPGLVTTLSGFGRGPGMLAGTTAQPGGLLELVTPIRIQSSLPGFEDAGAYGVLRVEFVPEPTSGALLATGALALVAGGRRLAARRGARAGR
jgi:hypothetical protein